MVWWQHPRYVYLNAIKDRARTLAGEDPGDDWLIESAVENYRHVGSRKNMVGHASRESLEAQPQYYEHHWRVREQLIVEGIDFDEARLTFKRERLWWATGVDLVAPLAVHNKSELITHAGTVIPPLSNDGNLG